MLEGVLNLMSDTGGTAPRPPRALRRFFSDSNSILEDIKEVVRETLPATQHRPLVIMMVMVGEHCAAECYLAATSDAARYAGVHVEVVRLDAATSHSAVVKVLERCNADPRVSGIVLQQPLPEHLSAKRLMEEVGDLKDVDAGNPRCLAAVKSMAALEDASDEVAILPTLASACSSILDELRPSNTRVLLLGVPPMLGDTLTAVLGSAGYTVTVLDQTLAGEHWTFWTTEDVRDLLAETGTVIVGAKRSDVVAASWVRVGCVIIDLGLSIGSTPPSPVAMRQTQKAHWPIIDVPAAPTAVGEDGGADLVGSPPSSNTSLGTPRSSAEDPMSGTSTPPPNLEQQAVTCLCCDDGLARRVAVLRLRNACHAALVQQDFLQEASRVSNFTGKMHDGFMDRVPARRAGRIPERGRRQRREADVSLM